VPDQQAYLGRSLNQRSYDAAELAGAAMQAAMRKNNVVGSHRHPEAGNRDRYGSAESCRLIGARMRANPRESRQLTPRQCHMPRPVLER
jgi:hypothetical protein